MKNETFILDARRTAIASPCRSLKDFSASALGAEVVCAVLKSTGNLSVDEVIMGNAVGARTGQNLARQVAVGGGVAVDVPAYTVNAVCGSGLQAVLVACRAIALGEARVIVVGGTESATHSPYVVARHEGEQGKTEDTILHDGLLCAMTGKSMGELCEGLVQHARISREEQDQFALKSHQKAIAATKAGWLKNEIIALKTPGGTFDVDERPREKLTLTRLAELPPAFSPGGTITAGNASAPADGSSVFLLADAETMKKQGRPLARIVDYVSIAVKPEDVFTGAVQAVHAVLKKSGLTIKDIDLFEITESFAAQAIYTLRELNLPIERTNICGGDVALGHPLGTSGARALVTLVHSLRREKKRRGLSSVCFGGGGAIALVVENVA